MFVWAGLNGSKPRDGEKKERKNARATMVVMMEEIRWLENLRAVNPTPAYMHEESHIGLMMIDQRKDLDEAEEEETKGECGVKVHQKSQMPNFGKSCRKNKRPQVASPTVSKTQCTVVFCR